VQVLGPVSRLIRKSGRMSGSESLMRLASSYVQEASDDGRRRGGGVGGSDCLSSLRPTNFRDASANHGMFASPRERRIQHTIRTLFCMQTASKSPNDPFYSLGQCLQC
jgi:hypothetical protein